MASLPYMQLYVADYLSDTMHLSTEEHGAYLLLMMTYWARGIPLPDDDLRLQSVCRANAEQWARIRPALEEFFVIEDGFWTHPRIEADLEKVQAKSEAARKSAQKRHDRAARKANAQRPKNERTATDERTDSERSANAVRTQCLSMSMSESEVKTRAAPAEPTVTELQAERVAEYFAGRIAENLGSKAPKLKPEKWVTELERAIRIDGHSPATLTEVIDWIYDDPEGNWWIGKISSGAKLREKMVNLLSQKQNPRTSRRSNGVTEHNTRAAQEFLAGGGR